MITSLMTSIVELNLPFGSGLELIIALFILVIIGAIIIMIVGALIFFLPAVIVAGAVWWLTGSEFWAGMAFLMIAVISLLKRK